MELNKEHSSQKCVKIDSYDISYYEPECQKAYIAIIELEEKNIGVFVAIGSNQEVVQEDLRNSGKVLDVLPLMDTLWKAKYILDKGNPLN